MPPAGTTMNDDNVYDFVEYKLAKYIEDLAAEGNEKDATSVWNIYNLYVSGAIDVEFRHGIPYYWLTTDKTDETP